MGLVALVVGGAGEADLLEVVGEGLAGVVLGELLQGADELLQVLEAGLRLLGLLGGEGDAVAGLVEDGGGELAERGAGGVQGL